MVMVLFLHLRGKSTISYSLCLVPLILLKLAFYANNNLYTETVKYISHPAPFKKPSSIITIFILSCQTNLLVYHNPLSLRYFTKIIHSIFGRFLSTIPHNVTTFLPTFSHNLGLSVFQLDKQTP